MNKRWETDLVKLKLRKGFCFLLLKCESQMPLQHDE